nr:MAG TPA: CHC2 zinc finger protein [Caudoviricetes sp.]DAT69712.1 MAG TPA: CHC2 zinc finger protein [Caudoviricetes sp.]
MRTNRRCNYCGREYYCCKSCISINSWKNSCCSVECYRKMLEEGVTTLPQEIHKNEEVVMILLRAGLTNGTTIDITGYDLELGKFDCTDGKTHVYEDFDYFIVPREEMKSIVAYFDEKIRRNSVQKKQKGTFLNNDTE